MHPQTFTTTEESILAAIILATLAGVTWLFLATWPAVVARVRLARQHHTDRKAAAKWARTRADDDLAASEERHKAACAAGDCPHPNHKPTPAYRADEPPEITAQRAGYNNGQRVPHSPNCKCTAKPIIDATTPRGMTVFLAGHYLDDDAYENADAYLARVRVLADDERKLRNAQRTIELVTAKGQRRRAAIRRLETRGAELRGVVETMRATLAATGHALDAAESERDQARQDAAIAVREYEDRVHAKQQEARWIEIVSEQGRTIARLQGEVRQRAGLVANHRTEAERLEGFLTNVQTALRHANAEVERQAQTIRRQQTLIDGANSDKAAALADRQRTIEQALRQQNADLNTIRSLRKRLRKLEGK